MIKGVFRCLCFLVFVAVIFQCREQEFRLLEYPGLETMSVTEVSASGAVFRARISRESSKLVTDHGFIWSLHANPQVNASERISLGAMKGASAFRTRIERSLYADTTYYVKAYVTTSEHTVYGKVVSFRSGGSLSPVVEALRPSSGTWSDTVVIAGRNFSALRSNVKVRFGASESLVFSSNDSTILCIVPREIADDSVQLSVTVNGQQSGRQHWFSLTSPVITAFTPTQARFGDTLVIAGSGFSRTLRENTVRFNEYVAQVISAGKQSLKVIVPAGLSYYENVISAEVHLREGRASQKFKLLKPQVTSISPQSGKPGTLVTITGANFSPDHAGNHVLFGSVTARIYGTRSGELKVIVPDGAGVGEVEVTVSVANQEVMGGGFTIE